MAGLGLAAGLIFPFFTIQLGVEANEALTPQFFAATIAAGLLVGGVSYFIAQAVIRPRLRLLSNQMDKVEKTIKEATFTGDWDSCSSDSCNIPVDSDDEIGESADAFNRLVKTLEYVHGIETGVAEFSHIMSSELELGSLAEKALDLLLQHTGAEAGALLIESSGKLTVIGSHGFLSPDQLTNSFHVLRAHRKNEVMNIEFPDDIKMEGVITSFQPSRVIVMPIEYNNVPIAVVVLAAVHNFDTGSIRLMNLFKEGLGLALQNAVQHEHLQKIAALDPLTGIYNRRFGLARMREEFTRAQRNNSDLSLMMFDIDHFKKVNDTHGHLVGDRVISTISKLAERILREGDVLLRYGGEEFCAVLPGANTNDAFEIAERLRRLVEEMVVNDEETEVYVTISIGLASYPQINVEREDQLLDKADQALYTAKKGGRNCVKKAR